MHKSTSRHSRNGHSTYNLAGDFANIKEALADASYDVRGRLNEILMQSIKDAKDKSNDMKDNVADFVSDKPFRTIGFALLAGLIIGFFLRK